MELYKNGNIIDFITSGNNGMYEFKDVSVSNGLNIFKLVFVGPYGEQKEEEKRIYVSPNSVNAGQLDITASITQDENYLFDLNDENNDYNNYTKTSIKAEYGLSSLVALSLAYSKTHDPIDKEVVYNFTQAGLNLATPMGEVKVFGAKNLELNKGAYSVSMTNQIWDWTLFSQYNKYNGIHSSTSLFSGEFADDMMEFKLTGRFGIPYLGTFPLYARYRRYSLLKQNDEDEQETGNNSDDIYNGLFEIGAIWQDDVERLYADEKIIRLSYPLKSFNFGAEYNETSYFSKNRHSTGSIKAIYKKGIATVKAEGTYNIEPKDTMQTSSIRLDLKPSNIFSVYTEYQHSYISDVDSYMFGFTTRTAFGNISLAAMTSSTKEKSILFSYNIGLLADQKNLSYMSQKYNNATSTGAVKLKAFIDSNANSLFDEGEEVLKDVKINASSVNEKKQYTDENGEIVMTGMSPYELSVFKVDVSKLEDISFIPEEEEFGYIPRPGYCKFIDIPIIQVADVEGAVFNTVGTKNVPLRGIIVKLLDMDGKELKKIISESDGSFMLSNIPYGKYKIVTNNEQMEKLRYEKTDVIEITVDEPYESASPIKLKKKRSNSL